MLLFISVLFLESVVARIGALVRFCGEALLSILDAKLLPYLLHLGEQRVLGNHLRLIQQLFIVIDETVDIVLIDGATALGTQ